MPFKIIKLLKKITFLSPILILWLLFIGDAVNAKTPKEHNSRSLQPEKIQPSSFEQLRIVPNVTQQKQTLISSNNEGAPFLRRLPTPGNPEFEPKRIPLTIPIRKPRYRTSPSITIITPSGYGASWGSAGVGIGFQERTRFRDEADGGIGLGFGLGNPRKSIGAQVGISLVDVSAPYRDGAINLKIHRRLPDNFSVATGVQGLATWGDTDGGSSVYGVVSKRFGLRKDRTKPFSELYTTVGIGGGQFRPESDIDNGIESVGVFGSVAVRIIEPVGFVTEWTGQDLTIGVPFVPFRRLAITVIPAITDVTGSAGDGTRFIFGVGYGFSF